MSQKKNLCKTFIGLNPEDRESKTQCLLAHVYIFSTAPSGGSDFCYRGRLHSKMPAGLHKPQANLQLQGPKAAGLIKTASAQGNQRPFVGGAALLKAARSLPVVAPKPSAVQASTAEANKADTILRQGPLLIASRIGIFSLPCIETIARLESRIKVELVKQTFLIFSTVLVFRMHLD